MQGAKAKMMNNAGVIRHYLGAARQQRDGLAQTAPDLTLFLIF